jgi:hypothetical protein
MQIRKLLCSLHYRKAANFLDEPVLKSQIRNFSKINPQLANLHIFTKYCTALSQNSPKSCLLKLFYYVFILIRAIFIRRKSMCLWPSGSRQIIKMIESANLNKLFKSANLRICETLAGRPSLICNSFFDSA